MGLRHRLDGLGRVLCGLDREDDVLSLAVHTHSVLLADSHVLGAIDHSDVVTSHQYAFRTFCLSVENMVTLHPCFCFFIKALLFLTTFQTTSEDIYAEISTSMPKRANGSLPKERHRNLLRNYNKQTIYRVWNEWRYNRVRSANVPIGMGHIIVSR